MNSEGLDEGINMEQHQADKNTNLRTSDVYMVKENLPKRFNNPDCFKGYRWAEWSPVYLAKYIRINNSVLYIYKNLIILFDEISYTLTCM